MFFKIKLLQVVSPQCVLEHEIAFHFVELHDVPVGPFLQTVAVHLEFPGVINEDVKWYWPRSICSFSFSGLSGCGSCWY